MTLTRTERPPARPSSLPPEGHELRVRVRQLRAEADATSERTAKAALLYEAGYLNEVLLRQPAQAVQDYLASYNADSRSRLPLHALVRMFERRRSSKNLTRLYDAEVRTARSPRERGTALTDQAALGALLGGDARAVQARLEQALEHEPKGDPALMLEWNRRAAQDADGAFRALSRRAESSDDPVHRGALLLELATTREERGEISAALEALRTAALVPESEPVQEVYALALAHFARQHGFTQELVEASERCAAQLSAELAELDAEGAGLDRSRARAAALWYEAARLRCTALSDPLGALRALDGARAVVPDDPLFKHMRMLAYDMLEDRERAAEEARSLLEAGMNGVPAAALHFRIAEHALILGDVSTARGKLVECIEVAGGSSTAEAILDDLLLDEGLHAERIARRERVADEGSANALEALGEAAQIATQELADAEQAQRLFERADALAPGNRGLLREAYGSALDLGSPMLARFALERLLIEEVDPDERIALVLHQLELASDEERKPLLERELSREDRAPLLLKVAARWAAEKQDYPFLARLHEGLAALLNDADDVAAELSAAARAWLRAVDLPRARQLLERALEGAPAQRYALTLLEEVLRQQGDAAAAIQLLHSAAERHASARDAELSLLSAGAAAEDAGNVDRAAQSYLEALGDGGQPSLGAAWALFRLAQRQERRDLERSARAALAAREQASGRAGVDTVLLAEHHEFVEQQPDAAEPLLQRSLSDGDVGHHAALGLALSRSAPLHLRAQALELLATRATDSLRPALLRELGGAFVAHSAGTSRVIDLVERVRRVRPDDRWSAWTRTHTFPVHEEEAHALASEAFASTTTDPQLAAAARAEALWARQRLAPRRSVSETLAALPVIGSELDVEAADMVLGLASPARDGTLRTLALDTVLRHAEPDARTSHLLPLARARLAQDDAIGALVPLEELLATQPANLAAWELAYEAARKAGRADLLASAAETLAEHLDGEPALELFEESATIRMDVLDDVENAERIYVRVLASAPRRLHAYTRLHELLKLRNDLPKLIAIVRRRAHLVDDPEELVKLYFELARLERERGELGAALDALDHVLMLDDEHLGALALSAEIHTARGAFYDAVQALDRLADASALPVAQRRLAGLGAADFLENKLDDRAGALERLERVVTLVPSDASVHMRIAELAERNMSFERAVSAIARAIELTPEIEARAALAVREADLLAQRLDRRGEAAAAYRRALEWAPGNLEAARALLTVSDDPSVLDRLESELRARASEAPRAVDPLRKLRTLAELKRDDELSFIALSALRSLGGADEAERAAWENLAVALHTKLPPSGRTLDPELLTALLGPAPSGPAAQLGRLVFAEAATIEQLTPARFGLGRSQRIGARDAHPLRDEIRALAAALGLALDELYVDGSEGTRCAALPREGALGFVIGRDLASPLRARTRHAVSMQLAGTALDTLSIVLRGPTEAARLLYAALAAEGALPSEVTRDELGELPRTVAKALPRKARRALGDLGRALSSSGASLAAHCEAELARTRRLALLLTCDLEASLREAAGSESAEIDLLRTWVGAAMSASRRKLGLAP